MVLRKRHPCVSWRLDRQILWKHLADLLVKLGGGSRVMKSMETIYRYNNAQHTHLYIYISYVNIGTYMHMYLYIYICKCIRIHSVMSGFAKKNPPKNHGTIGPSAAEAAPP